MLFGPDANRAAEMHLGTGPVRYHLGAADPTAQTRALHALMAALRPFEQPDGVLLRGAYWLVTAVRPQGSPRRVPSTPLDNESTNEENVS
jgi:hypothetical protein